MKGRVVVAMSGGVDSSVAAALLREAGYDVVGIAMRLASDNGAAGAARANRQSCCSYEDFEDARRVAELMDFPFYVVDLRKEFGARVEDYFVGEYLAGRTPNPCLMCNRDIKFDRLWSRARALAADYVATGHYARIIGDPARGFGLYRAADSSKDQSYFLFTLNQAQLARTLFPLGELTKAAVRARARELGLANADKPESQEICFVPDNDYAAFVARRTATENLRPGNFIDEQGGVLGTHGGIHNFTIGQRRGLGIAAAQPLYVKHIDPASGRVTLANRDRLGARGLAAREVSLVDPDFPEHAEIEVKIRYRHPPIPAQLRMLGSTRAEVRFHQEHPAVTPGQACVFYRGDQVLGGGLIEAPLS